MINLLRKELQLGVPPFFYVLPFLTGALMLIPGWIYFLVPLYFCFITVPNMFAGYKSQNDLMFTMIMPVTRRDMVKAKIAIVVLLELLHIIVAALYGLITVRLYPNLTYFFFEPTAGFWGLCFVMLAIFNLILISMYYKTAFNYGAAAVASILAAIVFACGAEWLTFASPAVHELFKGSGTDNILLQLALLAAGIAIFALCNWIAYVIALKRFEKVEAQ